MIHEHAWRVEVHLVTFFLSRKFLDRLAKTRDFDNTVIYALFVNDALANYPRVKVLNEDETCPDFLNPDMCYSAYFS